MQKLENKTHNITSKIRNNTSFQLYAPEDDKTGKHEHASEKVPVHGLQQPLVHVGIFDTHHGQVPCETLGLGGHAVFGTRVDFGAGVFPRGRKLW